MEIKRAKFIDDINPRFNEILAMEAAHEYIERYRAEDGLYYPRLKKGAPPEAQVLVDDYLYWRQYRREFIRNGGGY